MSVVIVTDLRRPCLNLVVEAVRRELVSAGVSFETVVTIDGSAADSDAVRGDLRRAGVESVIVCDAPRGPSASRNAGAAASRGEWLVFLDDDVLPSLGWGGAIHKIVDRASPAMVAGRLTTSEPTSGNRASAQQGALDFGEHPRALRRFEHLAAGHVVVARSIFCRLGGFSEALGPPNLLGRNEDVELHRRAFALGVPILWSPELSAHHMYPNPLDRAGWVAQGRSDAAVDRALPIGLRLARVAAMALSAGLPGPRGVFGRAYLAYLPYRSHADIVLRPAVQEVDVEAGRVREAWRQLAMMSDYGVFGGPAAVRACGRRRVMLRGPTLLWSGDAAAAVQQRRIGFRGRITMPATHACLMASSRGLCDRSMLLGSSSGQRKLAEHLIEQMGPWDALAFPLMEGRSATRILLAQAAEAAGLVTAWVKQDCEHVLYRNESWPYFGTPSTHRRRRLRKVLRTSSHLHVEIVTPLDRRDASNLVDLAAAVEARSWKAAAGTAKLAGRSRTGQHQLLVDAASDGHLVAAIAYDGLSPVGVVLGFSCGETFASYFGTYASSHSNLAPGVVLYLKLFEYFANTSVKEFSFLRGDEPYKASFGSEERELGLFVAGRNPGAVRRALWLSSDVPTRLELLRSGFGRRVLALTGRSASAWRATIRDRSARR